MASRVKQEYSHMVIHEAVVDQQLHGNIAANSSVPLWNVTVQDPNRVLLQQSSYNLFVLGMDNYSIIMIIVIILLPIIDIV